ncbi:MAG: hypothetical protein BTN85_0946 [Candidatus Methanohalarchaeum thermophilum]|uniref:Uncharacterized protein n=1 Tax=Methanohalarchaeum thermophilum TaxID=1903181 RepID=A0A1Q6DVR6_METT1|nr:MAG: hypothetical protein BTN85_0946 [Candidatus Methanohalarchaeum thermophilum]
MRAEKTIVCRITEPNKGGSEVLKRGVQNRVQQCIRGEEVGIYSATA